MTGCDASTATGLDTAMMQVRGGNCVNTHTLTRVMVWRGTWDGLWRGMKVNSAENRWCAAVLGGCVRGAQWNTKDNDGAQVFGACGTVQVVRRRS
jgi:hypothetical protein